MACKHLETFEVSDGMVNVLRYAKCGQNLPATIKRFAITHLAEDGLRTLAFANQGRHHYDTKELAESALTVMRSGLESRLGLKALEVREVECYPHGDAVGIYFETDYQPVSGIPPFTATCCVCQKAFVVGEGVDEHGRGYSKMYADTTGTPWKAYYCENDSKAARELQEVTNAKR